MSAPPRHDARDDEQRHGTTTTPSSPDLRPLPSPGPWVTPTACTCGATYEGSSFGVRFGEGVERVRQAAFSGGDASGGFRRRRSVLWAMRTIKLERWYMAHASCGGSPAPQPEQEPYPGYDPVLGF